MAKVLKQLFEKLKDPQCNCDEKYCFREKAELQIFQFFFIILSTFLVGMFDISSRLSYISWTFLVGENTKGISLLPLLVEGKKNPCYLYHCVHEGLMTLANLGGDSKINLPRQNFICLARILLT